MTTDPEPVLSVDFCRDSLRRSLEKLRDRQVITAAEFATTGQLIESAKTRDWLKASRWIGHASIRTKQRPWTPE